jgi:hypothetical protein
VLKLYVASSARNAAHTTTCRVLSDMGYAVLNVRTPGDVLWERINPTWQAWTFEQYRAALRHPCAAEGFRADMDALLACDVCVMVLPCGASSHLELGFGAGARKATIVYAPLDLVSPSDACAFALELMYAMCDRVLVSLKELAAALEPLRNATRECQCGGRLTIKALLRASAMCDDCIEIEWAVRARDLAPRPCAGGCGRMIDTAELCSACAAAFVAEGCGPFDHDPKDEARVADALLDRAS